MTIGLRLIHFLNYRTGMAAILAATLMLFSASSTNAEDVLTIGDKAPKLDIEHWLSDRDGEFSGFSGFEKDKVYIVEFWATWCPPCITSMPHLAELQDELAEKGVQIISVSKEDLETVEKFLEKPVRGDKEKTYAELTSAYCLTTDPDESVSKDYMQAAGQGGIPTAFIIGKTGEIEWIGHPMQMDKPLEEILDDKWDRATFAKEFAKEQKPGLVMSAVSRLMEADKPEEALEKVDSFLENDAEGVPERTVARMKRMRSNIAMAVGGEVAVAAFKSMIEDAGDDQRTIGRLTSLVIKIKQSGGEVDDAIMELACEAAGNAVELAEKGGKDKATAKAMHTHANLLYLCEKLEDAIAVQKKAVELSDEKQIAKFLEKLEEELAKKQG